MAIAHNYSGNLDEATRYYTEGLPGWKTQIGDVAGRAMIMLNLGEVYRSRGDQAQARQMFEQSLHIFQDLRYTQAVALLENNLAATAIAEGEWGAASSHLDESKRLFSEIGSEDFKAELHRHRAELTLGQGQIDNALESAQQALEVAEAGQEKLEIGLARRVLRQVYLALDDPAQAERELLASLWTSWRVWAVVSSQPTREWPWPACTIIRIDRLKPIANYLPQSRRTMRRVPKLSRRRRKRAGGEFERKSAKLIIIESEPRQTSPTLPIL